MVYGVVLGMKPPEAHRSDGDGAQDVDGRITTDNRHVLHAADTDDRRQQRVSRPITVTSCMQQTPTTDGNSDSRVTWTGEEACLGLAAVNARGRSVPLTTRLSQVLYITLTTLNCLQIILPTPRDPIITTPLKSANKFPRLTSRTRKYQTFISYALARHQTS